MLKVSTFEQKFVDSDGRERIFTGVNLCDKGYYEYGYQRRVYNFAFGEELISELSKKGFNIVRLGMTWDAIEPEPFKYDDEFLDRVMAVADLCEKYGLYFYLDMHQDLYGGPADSPADGAPVWACITEGAKFKPTKFVWAEGYFWGKAVHKSFDNFWANKEYNGIPLQTYFCTMWKHVVEKFKDHPALFGYDLLNEPFPGSDGGKVFRKLIAGVAKTVITDKRCKKLEMLKNLVTGNAIKCLEPFDDPEVFKKVTENGNKLIEKFDTGAYSEFINRTSKAVREVTDNGIIMMENSYYSNLGIPYSAPAVNYDGVREKQLCFAPHAYDLMVDTPAYKYASNSRVGAIFDEHRRSQQKLDIPVIVGEWGGQSDGFEWLHHINFLLNKFDSYHWSHTYWNYYGESMLTDPIMTSLLRPSPIAVCGDIIDYKYDRENDRFSLNFNQKKIHEYPTEIFIHKHFKSIACTAEYKAEPIEGTESSIIKIYSEPGLHSISVSF